MNKFKQFICFGIVQEYEMLVLQSHIWMCKVSSILMLKHKKKYFDVAVLLDPVVGHCSPGTAFGSI